MADDDKRSFTGTIRRALNRFTASYRPPVEEQVRQAETGQAWFRDFAWEEFATKYLPGLGMGFSIHPERITVFKDNDGIHLYTFQEAWDKYSIKFPIKSAVVTLENDVQKPIEYIELPPTTLFTVSHNGSTNKTEWQEVRSIIRHHYKGTLIALKQKYGETIVTPNHSVYASDGKTKVRADTNPTLFAIRNIPEIVTIRDSYKLPYPPHERKESGKWGRVYHSYNNVKRIMNREELLAFSRFLGAYVAEGCYWFYDGGRKGLVHISNNDVEWLKSLGRDAEKFMTKVKWRIDKQSTNKQSNLSTYCLSIRSSDLASMLATMVGKGAANKRIPEFLFEAAKEYRDAFLTNYTIGDGETSGQYIITNNGTQLMQGILYSGTTRSSKLVAGLALLFAMDGLDFSTYSHKDHHGKQMYRITQVTKHTTQYIERRIFEQITYEGYLFDISVKYNENFADFTCGICKISNTVYPYAAVWEKIWGAVPVEDYIKYKQLYDQEPFIRGTIDIHTLIAVGGGFEIDYPIDSVIEDIEQFFTQHDFFNQLKILVRDALLFGSSYAEIVRTWVCHHTGHDLNQLRVSYEEKFPKPVSVDGKPFEGFWWADRIDVAHKHNELYPDHQLENPYGEITRIKPLDPTYIRVRRDAYGSLQKFEKIVFFNGNNLIKTSINDYIRKAEHSKEHIIETFDNDTRLIKHDYTVPTMSAGNVELRKAPHIFEHHYTGDMYDIYTKYGRKISVTGNHSIFLWQPKYPEHVMPGQVVLKEAREIKEGDYALVATKLPVPVEKPFNYTTFTSILDAFATEKPYFKQKRDMLYIPCSRTKLPNNITDNNGLLYFLGLIISDGCIYQTKHNNVIVITGDSISRNNTLIDWLTKNNIKFGFIKGQERRHWKEQKQPTSIPSIRINNKILCQVVKALIGDGKSIPSWIYQLPLSQLKWFIKGLWDGDGWHTSTANAFKIYTRNKELADDIVLLLMRFGIGASINTRKSAKGIDYTVQAFLDNMNILTWDSGVKQITRATKYGDFLIAKITKLNKYTIDDVVYDFEVPNTQSFINNSGILCHNTVLGYTQYYMFPLVTFLADEVMMLRYTPSSFVYESVYGTSMLRPILFHQELLKEYEQIIGQIMNVYLKPMFLVKLGNPNMPGADNITAEQYAAIARQFANRVPGRDIIVRQGSIISEIQPIQAPIQSLQTSEFWLTWLHNMRQYALNVPKFLVDPAGLNKATAQVVQEAYFTFINSIRQSISAQLTQFLFPKILYSLYGETANKIIEQYGLPKIIWKPVKEESMADKAPLVIDMFRNNLIDLNEARNMLGLKPKEDETTPRALLPGRIVPSTGGGGSAGAGAGAGDEGTSIENQISEQLQDEYLTDLSTPNQPSPGGGDTLQQSGAAGGGTPGGAPPPGTVAMPLTEQRQILDTLDDLEDYADQLRRKLKRRR